MCVRVLLFIVVRNKRRRRAEEKKQHSLARATLHTTRLLGRDERRTIEEEVAKNRTNEININKRKTTNERRESVVACFQRKFSTYTITHHSIRQKTK